MSWKPTEGMKRAQEIVDILVHDAGASETILAPVFQYRMREVIGQWIDLILRHHDEESQQRRKAVGNSGHELPYQTRGYYTTSQDDLSGETEALERMTGVETPPAKPLEAATAATKAEKAPRKRKGGRKARRKGKGAPAEDAAPAPSEGA